MKLAVRPVLVLLAEHLQSRALDRQDPPPTAEPAVTFGSWAHVVAGRDFLEKLAPGGWPVYGVGLTSVSVQRETDGAPVAAGTVVQEFGLLIVSTRRLDSAAAVWDIRLTDCAWLTEAVQEFCLRMEDPADLGKELHADGLVATRLDLTEFDYTPNENEDLEAGAVTVAVTLSVRIMATLT
jgi:hypothetical protein